MMLLACSRCRLALAPEQVAGGQHICRFCLAEIDVTVYPVFFQPEAPVNAGERVLLDEESSCFYHPQKKAVVPCDGCGRFLCALCDVELRGEHLCSLCIEAGISKRTLAHIETQRTRYDSIALALALLPLLIFYFTILTAPAALYIAIRYWKAPPSMLGRWRTRINMSVAATLAVLQIAGWVTLFGFLFTGGFD